jgi:O-antigen/teichoic acid export membrane protein
MTANPGKGAFDRVFSGLASASLHQAIAAAYSILLVPLFLRVWGADGYGRWLLLTAFVSYLGLLDLGGQHYIGNLLAFDYSKGDESAFRERLEEGLSVFSLLSFAALLVLAAALCYPALSLPAQDTPLTGAERGVLLFMGCSFLLSVPQGVFVTIYRATGKLFAGMMIGNAVRLFSLFGISGLLLVESPPVVVAAGYFLSALILTAAVVVYGFRGIPQCRGVRLSVSAAWRGRKYLGGAFFFWLLLIAGAANYQGILIILGAFAAPAVVAIYATHRTASGLLGYIGNLFMAPVWPELSFAHAAGDKEKCKRVGLLAVRVVVYLNVMAAVALWAVLPEVYSVWTARELPLQPALAALFLVQGILVAGWSTAAWALLASNEHRSLAWWAVANVGVTLALAALFAPRYGVMGVAAATLIGDLACGAAVYPRKAARHLDVPPSKVYRAIFRPVLAAVPAGALVLLCSSLPAPLTMRVLAMTFVLIALFYPSARLAFGREDWGMVTGRIRNLATGLRA